MALASVYFHTLGRQTEVRGGPAVVLPTAIELQPLDEALATLSSRPEFETRLHEAVWTMLRATAAPRSERDVEEFETRYPPELFAVHDAEKIREFDDKRRIFRSDAHLFAAALVSLVNLDKEQFESLASLYGESDGGGSDFAGATVEGGFLGDVTPLDLLRDLLSRDFETAAVELAKLEHEVGLSIYDFVEEFADAVAYLNWSDLGFDRNADVYVFPASTAVVQEADSLTTTVTVTALVRTPDFERVRIAIDPRSWARSSDVFAEARYVKGPRDLGTKELREPIGVGFPDEQSHCFLERVRISWGPSPTQVGEFLNVLRIEKFTTGDDRVDLDFSLDRCLRSRFLWDQRAGGIVIDEGYVRARPIAPGVWRVTTRKTLQFSDRTPYSGATGWFDFGQLLNYLAPATLTWWLESEVYSSAREHAIAGTRRAVYEPGETDGRPERKSA